LKLDTQSHEELLVLTPDERRLDAQASLPFKDAFLAAVTDHSGPIGLDLSNVGFMDSSGLGAVVACFKQLGPGRSLVVISPTEAVRKLLTLTRIDRVLPVVGSKDEALQRTRA
jgi:anti-sigma B factor antagonist